MEFDYLHASEPDPFTFYRIPKELFDDPVFSDVSTLAKVLYGIFLDRTSLSRKKGWIDGKGNLYIIFTIRQIQDCLRIGNKYAEKLLDELENKAHLIERVRQGFGKPNLIYVKNFSVRVDAVGHFKTCPKDISGNVRKTLQDVSDGQPTNTDNSETDMSETDLLLRTEERKVQKTAESSAADDEQLTDHANSEAGRNGENSDLRKAYQEHFDETAGFPWLMSEDPAGRDQLKEIRELLIDTCCSRRKEIMIGGELIRAEQVRSRFMKLGPDHIRYVMKALRDNTEMIRNMKAYLLTLLYNAPLTIQSYYQAWYNHDRAEEWNE